MSRRTARLQTLFSVGVAVVVALLWVVLFTSCSTDGSGGGGGGGGGSGGVRWSDYAPSLHAKIDAMATAKDCDALQIEFNQIGATNLAMRNRFGHGNLEVLKYIDDKEREASCF